jgi:hypothetical protein
VIKQKIDDPAKEMVAQNAEHQRQKQELEVWELFDLWRTSNLGFEITVGYSSKNSP